MPNYLIESERKRLPFGASPRVMNLTTNRVHVGYHTPDCSPSNSRLSYTGSFRAVSCPHCLALHPEAMWPTPQRETTEEGKWAILDFGFCFVAACQTKDGGWKGVVTPSAEFEGRIKSVYCGGKRKKTFRQIFNSVFWYINNGYSWKSATTFNQIGDK